MPEMTYSGKDHGDAVLVGCGDDFFVTHRAARLDDCAGTGRGQYVETIAEGEESVRGDD